MGLNETKHYINEATGIMNACQHEVNHVHVEDGVLLNRPHRRADYGRKPPLLETREDRRIMVPESVVEGQQAGVGWQHGVTLYGRDDLVRTADGVVLREIVQLAFEPI